MLFTKDEKEEEQAIISLAIKERGTGVESLTNHQPLGSQGI